MLAYAFGEGEGSTTEDASAHGLTGTLVNGPVWTTSGRFGSGLTFDGENDRVDVPASPPLDLTTAVTLEAWIYRSVGGAAYQTLLIKENSDQPSYSLSMTSEGRIDFLVGLVSGARTVASERLVPAGTWTHLAATYDGQIARLWMNGIEDVNVAFTGSLVVAADPLRLGSDNIWGRHFAGRLDEIRIYSRALTAAEITADMETPLAPSGPPIVTRVSPATGALGMAVMADVIATFSVPIDPATVTGTTFELRNGPTIVPATVSYDASTRRARLLPDSPLTHSTTYTATVRGGVAGVTDLAGVTLTSDVTWSFTTMTPPSEPIAAYSLSEQEGTVAADRSGNGHTGLVQGAAWTADGRYGSALSFDGADDRVTVVDSDLLDFATAFTLEMWINRAEGAGYQTLLIKENGDLPPYSLSMTNDGRIDFVVRLTSDNRTIASTTLVPANAWTHVAATYDGATARLWINGLEDAAVSFSGAIVTSIGPLRLGGDNIWFRHFAGRLDEVRLYSRALSASEIVEDMQSSIDDETPPVVTSTVPGTGAIDVNPGAEIVATFSESLHPSSINGTTFVLSDPGGNLVPAFISYDAATSVATLDPAERLTNLTTYTVTLEGGAGGARVTDLAGNALASDYTWTFTTADAETTPPSITPILSPPANSAGWHKGPITVTFVCADASGVAICPEPVTVSQEGAGQVVERSAIDAVGNEATASITVNIDRTPGSVVIAAPTSGTTTSDASISLAGTVADGLSGTGATYCNGEFVEPIDGAVQCVVALRPGRNTLTVSLLDLAGNSASSGVVVTRTVTPALLQVQPQAQTLAVGESRALGAHADDGTSPAGLAWMSSNPAVASIAADGVVTAHVAGETIITATAGSLSATATIQVLAGGLAPGTLRWRSDATPGFSSRPTIYANRVDDEGPDMFAVETAASGLTVLRALRSDGTQLWTETAPATPLFGDAFGGVIGLVPAAWPGWGKGIARFAAPANEGPWRYESEGYIRPVISEGAEHHSVMQSPDGTVYAIERVDNPDGTAGKNTVIALDGDTGAVKFRVPLPFQYGRTHPSATCPGSGEFEGEAWSGPLSADADGTVYVAAVEIESDERPTCDAQGNLIPEQTELTQTWQLHLLRIAPTGAVVRQTLWEDEFTTLLGPSASGIIVMPGTVVPDGQGGVLVNWTHVFADMSDVAALESRVTRAAAGASVEHTIAAMQVPDSQLFEHIESAVVLSGDRTAYVRTASTLKAVDVVSWAELWTRTTTGLPIVALDGGGVLVHEAGTSSVVEVDSNGDITNTVSIGVLEPTSLLAGQGSIHGRDGSTLGVSEFAFPDFCEAGFSYKISGGRASGQSQPRKCRSPGFGSNWKSLTPGAEYVYRFVDGDPSTQDDDWQEDQKAAIREAFRLWTEANALTGLNTWFIELQGEGAQHLTLKKALIPNNPQTGNPVPAGIAPGPTAQDGTITGAVVLFNMNQSILLRGRGYLKAGLHEIGHLLGLADTHGFNGTSVMNQFGIRRIGPVAIVGDDAANNVATRVTPCDRTNAKLAAEGAWPRP